MIDYEAQRQANMLHKQQLLEQLSLASSDPSRAPTKPITSTAATPHSTKKRRVAQILPMRTSARIAAAPIKTYNENTLNNDGSFRRTKVTRSRTMRTPPTIKIESKIEPINDQATLPPPLTLTRTTSLSDLLDHWNKWSPTAPQPTLTSSGYWYFEDHPNFTPNKSPLEILLEGAFGGSYFSSWYSRTLGLTLEDDYLHTLPKDWLHELSPHAKYLTSPIYTPTLNKFQVPCGQTLTEWEAAGWLNFEFDPRGWFEWYIRFFLGRRCDDDDRQIKRWIRCVGPKGRWKRILLKKYIDMGVTSVYADQDDEDIQVSPVIHQTCHHWAYEVRQDDLDHAWAERRRQY
ncbi:hypothetical protein LTR84_012657 [Exophiala bonariae]|uniref:Uncharacterized protein n=1 Tax=Exophiala bonariae TaxID=1690606 RepID=A0AAV9NID6_9EURO|nr:hypothetical protein LTR84_012657 [Exophiala bonariae]